MTERFEVQRLISAEPATIFDVLTSPAGHVSIDSSGMLQSADGERVGTVGDRFTVHMDRESLNDLPMGKYDVDVVITAYEPDRLIEWTIDGQIQPPLEHVYGYELRVTDGGTSVTSYYDWSKVRDEIKSLDVFPVIPEAGLRATLGILARNVESR